MENGLVYFIETITKYGLEYLGIYLSKYKAVVYDNNDPSKMNRLRLVVTEIDDRVPLKTWAIPVNQFGGPDYGSQCLPQKGDIVWVEFEYGRLENPIWTHGYYAENEKPKDFDDINVYGFKTPKGHFVTIDDTKDIITVKHKDGLTLSLKQSEFYIGKDSEKLEPMVLGETLKKELEIEKARIDTLLNAIQQAPIVPTDGGASFKAAIVAATSTLQAPNYSKINSEISKLE
jgi:hypothetical protein